MDTIEIVNPRKRERDHDTVRLGPYETYTDWEHVHYTRESTVRAADPTAVVEASSSASSSDDDEDLPDGAVDSLTCTSFYQRFVSRTRQQARNERDAPQRSQEWLDARLHAITGSNFGAATGHNKYMTPDQCLLDKLWSRFKGNEYTAYGTFHENDAAKSFLAIAQGPLWASISAMFEAFTGRPAESLLVAECGLLKDHRQAWMAVSPDGLLYVTGHGKTECFLIEYKCPARLRDSEGHPYVKSAYNVPEYYMDQIQGIMGLLSKYPDTLLDHGCKRVSACFFVVWQPHQVHVTRVPYDLQYYSNVLEPSLERFYFDRYLPLATLKHMGLLVPGTLTASATLDLDDE